MSNLIDEIEKEQMDSLTGEKGLPDFRPGDTVAVHTKVVEGQRERIQVYEGVCIARKNAGMASSFTVRKVSFGEGVERVFPLYSPSIDHIEISRRGKVRRSKLYYLRERRGRAARIEEDTAMTRKDLEAGRARRKAEKEAKKAAKADNA